jgi:hypothetical protein
MARFQIGDPVRVLPQYERLYSAAVGVVVAIRPDDFGRPAFDQYVVQFPPHGRHLIYDFRLVSAYNAPTAASAQVAS